MATLVFSSLGTMLGGPVGGAIGSLVGSQIDRAMLGSSRRDGPRLKDLAVTASQYGQTIPRIFGRMRVAGTVIWATELVEQDEILGAGKSAPAIQTYSYSANFAVALSSRPILGIRRIWADGQLLRGANGDLKVSGMLRLYTGQGDQAPDPLIESAEGLHSAPAYRDLAYVVFEGLDLSQFYNRIPNLTFEVIADDDFNLETIITSSLPEAQAPISLSGITGYVSEGPPAQDIQVFEQVLPLHINANQEALRVVATDTNTAPKLLGEPAITTADDAFGITTGFTRHRAAPFAQTASIIRYYDIDRNYQPSVQRAVGKAQSGQPSTIELPAVLDATAAREWIDRTSHRIDWSRDQIQWRTSQLDPAITTGSVVTLPQIEGHWQVQDWEWRESGVELTLVRIMPAYVEPNALWPSDSGRINPPLDSPSSETRLMAFELPIHSTSDSYDVGQIFAAVAGTQDHWNGAALFAVQNDGQMTPLGPSGRRQAKIGHVETLLPGSNPCYFDQVSKLIVKLEHPSQTLNSISMEQLAQGGNLALVGEEIIQFLNATPLENGLWCLTTLLRGLGGTEHAVANHEAHETFALLNADIVRLDTANASSLTAGQIAAIGLGDTTPVTAPVLLNGIRKRPLPPVHPRRQNTEGGTVTFTWARRPRGFWSWQDETDLPLIEQDERYIVMFGNPDALITETLTQWIAQWTVAQPRIDFPSATLEQLAEQMPHGAFYVSQLGTHDLSRPTSLGNIF